MVNCKGQAAISQTTDSPSNDINVLSFIAQPIRLKEFSVFFSLYLFALIQWFKKIVMSKSMRSMILHVNAMHPFLRIYHIHYFFFQLWNKKLKAKHCWITKFSLPFGLLACICFEIFCDEARMNEKSKKESISVCNTFIHTPGKKSRQFMKKLAFDRLS